MRPGWSPDVDHPHGHPSTAPRVLVVRPHPREERWPVGDRRRAVALRRRVGRESALSAGGYWCCCFVPGGCGRLPCLGPRRFGWWLGAIAGGRVAFSGCGRLWVVGWELRG